MQVQILKIILQESVMVLVWHRYLSLSEFPDFAAFVFWLLGDRRTISAFLSFVQSKVYKCSNLKIFLFRSFFAPGF